MTSDIFDDASEMEELHRSLSIQNIRKQRKTPFTGYCLSCNEIVTQGRFCSAECREDFELEQKIKRISGR
jgi:hypothetical protein